MVCKQITVAGKRYEVDSDTKEVIGAQACCYACDNEREQGHFLCEVPAPGFTEAEERGEVYRSLDYSAWRWYLSN